ncbi:hypothetical protein Godav_011672, partial [Gossypium davidsonii]|nr:hypothetical protein [Gossypium davidsonii]MBA0646008.1 hypothetical protein [Gossypium klotzschianum]
REANTQDGVADVPLKVILSLDRPRSWKDSFIGTGLRAYDKTKISTKDDDHDLDRLDEDIMRSLVNSIPAIDLYYQPFAALPQYGYGLDMTTGTAWTFVQEENTLGNRGNDRK